MPVAKQDAARLKDRSTPAHDATGTCVVAGDDEGLCGRDALPGAPWPMCVQHALDAYRHVARIMTDRALDEQRRVHGLAEIDGLGGKWAGQACPDAMNGWPAVVYYMQVGDLIKIGTTRHLQRRVSYYPPGSRLLAVEPGAEAVERHRHEQFADLRVARNEWFRPGAELMAHVEVLAAAGLPAAPRPAESTAPREDAAQEGAAPETVDPQPVGDQWELAVRAPRTYEL